MLSDELIILLILVTPKFVIRRLKTSSSNDSYFLIRASFIEQRNKLFSCKQHILKPKKKTQIKPRMN